MKKVVTVITTSGLLIANNQVMQFWIGTLQYIDTVIGYHIVTAKYCDTSICQYIVAALKSTLLCYNIKPMFTCMSVVRTIV